MGCIGTCRGIGYGFEVLGPYIGYLFLTLLFLCPSCGP